MLLQTIQHKSSLVINHVMKLMNIGDDKLRFHLRMRPSCGEETCLREDDSCKGIFVKPGDPYGFAVTSENVLHNHGESGADTCRQFHNMMRILG